MDSFIYSLVLVPALTELLPRSGIEATPGNVGFYGSVLFALFLIGWGVSMVWGPIADRFGRVRTLTLTILCYSLFTLLCGARHQHLAARGAAVSRRHRHRRRVGDGRHLHRRGMARGSAQGRRRLHAHRLLLRLLPRGAGQLLRRREVRLALDVRGRRHAGAAHHLHPERRARVRDVAGGAPKPASGRR